MSVWQRFTETLWIAQARKRRSVLESYDYSPMT